MSDLDVRPTRLLYVENDSALRRILGEMLGKSKELEILGTYAKSDDVLNRMIPVASQDAGRRLIDDQMAEAISIITIK